MAYAKPTVTYVLPHPNFFAPGKAGQVVHAEGVLEGLLPLAREVRLLAAPDAPDYLRDDGGAIRFEAPPKPDRFWYLRLARRLARHVDADGPDVVLIRSQPLFLLLMGVMLALSAHRRRRRYCIEVNGLGFSFAKQGGGDRLVIALSTLAYKILLRPFDFVQVVNDDLGARLGSGILPIAPRKLLVVHNGGPKPGYAPVEEGEPKELHLFFFGLFNSYNDFPLLLDAVAAAREAGCPVVLHLIGHGKEGDWLRSRADGRTVRVYDAMSRAEFSALVRRTRGMRAGVLPMRFGNGSGSLSPLKAFEYMALGIPLLYSSNCLQDVLVHDVHGAMYAEGDRVSLTEQIVRLADPRHHARYSAAIREHYPLHTWERRMADLMSGVLASDARAG